MKHLMNYFIWFFFTKKKHIFSYILISLSLSLSLFLSLSLSCTLSLPRSLSLYVLVLSYFLFISIVFKLWFLLHVSPRNVFACEFVFLACCKIPCPRRPPSQTTRTRLTAWSSALSSSDFCDNSAMLSAVSSL